MYLQQEHPCLHTFNSNHKLLVQGRRALNPSQEAKDQALTLQSYKADKGIDHQLQGKILQISSSKPRQRLGASQREILPQDSYNLPRNVTSIRSTEELFSGKY